MPRGKNVRIRYNYRLSGVKFELTDDIKLVVNLILILRLALVATMLKMVQEGVYLSQDYMKDAL